MNGGSGSSQVSDGSPIPGPGTGPWWDAHQRRLARRRPRDGGLTVEVIVDEALDLADADGLDALTVRSLASRLDTSSATLYRHVASVDELLVLMIDRVLGEIAEPDEGLPDRERLLMRGHRFRAVLLAHPGVVPALRLTTLLGPNAKRAAAAGLDDLLALGFPPAQAVAAYLALIDYILGAVFFDSTGQGDQRSRQEQEGQEYPETFTRTRPHFQAASADEVFRFGLEAFVDGLLSRLTREH